MQTEKVIDHITSWLKDYATQAGANGFVVGVSGGIDSAVTSSLCAKTGLRTLCVEMPIHQPQDHVSRAQEHIKQLKRRFANVSNVRVNLTDTFETFQMALPALQEGEVLNLSLANTRARFRMSTLYYFAGMHNYLVAGTGNKVEDFGVGFYTKYGDGGVDLSPIADLMKSEVYKIAKELLVPESIQQAKPSDGLWQDDRSDEDQIGASYDELEWAMKMDESGKTIEDFTAREREVFKIYKRFNTANKHKMLPIPICEIPKNLQ